MFNARTIAATTTAAAAAIAFVIAPVHAQDASAAADPHDLGTSLQSGQKLMAGDYLANGAYEALMRPDGNFVVTKNGTDLFESDTYVSGSHAVMYADGNFSVVNPSGTTLWWTLTSNTDANQLVLRSSGDLAVSDKSGATLWATFTDHGNEMGDAAVYSKAIQYLGQYNYEEGGGHGANPGPTNGTLDCSGFVRWMYSEATGKDKLDGTAADQFDTVGGKVGSATHQNSYGAPGSLVFYYGTDGDGGPTYIHHVGIYVGGGRIINEFNDGDKIQLNGIHDSIGTVEDFYDVPAA